MLRAYPRHTTRFNTQLFLTGIKSLFTIGDGNSVELFEKKFAEFIGTKYAVAIPSARYGLYVSLKNIGLCKGEEVIMPAYTFKAVGLAVIAAGFKPVFVDVKKGGCNIDEDLIEERINPKTRAIIVSHLFGIPCNLEKIKEITIKYNLKLIEDCAHACGAEYKNNKLGSFGDLSLFSFGIGKNLDCLGGGMIITDDDKLNILLKDEIRSLKIYRWADLFKENIRHFSVFALTSRPLFSILFFPVIFILGMLDSDYLDRISNEDFDLKKFCLYCINARKFNKIQAELGLLQLKEIADFNKKINQNALLYDQFIYDNINLRHNPIQENSFSVRYYYMLRVKRRKEFRINLLYRGIDTKADDMYDCSTIKEIGRQTEVFPNTSRLVDENVEIPNNISLQEKDIGYISKIVNQYR